MGNLIKKEESEDESDRGVYMATLDDIEKADNLLIKGKWAETFSRWGATKWDYIPTKTKPSRLMLLIHVNHESNLSRFPMFIGGLEIVPIVVRCIG